MASAQMTGKPLIESDRVEGDDWSSHAGGCISTRVNKPQNDDASIPNEEPG